MDFMRNTNVNSFDEAMTRCVVCLYKDSCKRYMTNITSNPSTVKEDMEIAVQEVIDCKDFYIIDGDNQDNESDIVDKIYNRDDYGIEYNTYIHEFYEG